MNYHSQIREVEPQQRVSQTLGDAEPIGEKEEQGFEFELEEMDEGEDDEGGDEEDAGGDDGGGGGGEEHGGGEEFEAPAVDEIPIGEIASVAGVAATAAASSDFVRSQVKPEEFAKGKAKEAAKKEA